ncbi:glycosyltransferase [Paenibacillus kobensis]|uniref:glycosyltransferase n=1 Tax=Paenibacillus kobensis TaxID=59841 RepID=UPI001FE8773B|nr:glycosyltransferase [Paenibacillus kobensis]
MSGRSKSSGQNILKNSNKSSGKSSSPSTSKGGSEAYGVTIITPTIRPQYMKRVLSNYARQQWENKELIIVLNGNRMNMQRYLQAAEQYSGIHVIRLPASSTLGDCLNDATAIACYPYIAKFDDDDYYGPGYLAEAMDTFEKTGADVVGKTSFFFYFPHRRQLLLRERPVQPYEETNRIAGATIMFRRNVLETVSFGKRKQGSDVQFIQDCLRSGLSVRTSSAYNFAAFRRADRQSHTWKVTERKLFTDPRTKVFRTDDYWKIVDRQPEQLLQTSSRIKGPLLLKQHRQPIAASNPYCLRRSGTTPARRGIMKRTLRMNDCRHR